MTKNLKAFALAAVVFVAAFAVTTVAQNNIARFDSYAQGAPGFTLQAAGSKYGQIQNVTSTTWGLGAGTAQDTNGTTAFTWDALLPSFPQTNKAGFDAGVLGSTTQRAGSVAQCSDCTNTYTFCVATGTTRGQWRQLISAGATNTTKAGCGASE